MNALAWLNPGRWLAVLWNWLEPGRWLAVFFACSLAWLAYPLWRGHQQDIGYQRAVADFKAQAERVDAKREVVTQYVDRVVEKTVKDIQVVTETITKEVPVYVPSDTPDLPAGWRLLHDAAARGEVPNPAGLADAAAVPAQDAANTVIANYGTCRETAERLRAFQTWATQQQTAR